jgi:hypothetical protein
MELLGIHHLTAILGTIRESIYPRMVIRSTRTSSQQPMHCSDGENRAPVAPRW